MEHEQVGPEPAQKDSRKAAAPPAAARAGADGLLSVQRRAGNRVATALLRAQPKLSVGAAHDPAEREADQAAASVVETLRRAQSHATGAIGAAGGDIDAETAERLEGARGRGRPLARGAREAMEGAFGADFGHVRVHSGPEARALNERLSARAFTVGPDIFFRGPAPDAGAGAGQELLAHELAHVVQQSTSPESAQRSIIRREWMQGSVTDDAKLFERAKPIPKNPVPMDKNLARFYGIKETNLDHYLERHTFKYQRLSAATISPAATMFPVGTTAEEVGKLLNKAVEKLPNEDNVGTSAVSNIVEVDGMKLNLGALRDGKLSAFFPISGTGVHDYTADELSQLRDEKNRQDAEATPAASDAAAAPAVATGAPRRAGPAPTRAGQAQRGWGNKRTGPTAGAGRRK